MIYEKDYKLCNLFCIFKDIFYILTIEERLCEKESYKDYVKLFIPQKRWEQKYLEHLL